MIAVQLSDLRASLPPTVIPDAHRGKEEEPSTVEKIRAALGEYIRWFALPSPRKAAVGIVDPVVPIVQNLIATAPRFFRERFLGSVDQYFELPLSSGQAKAWYPDTLRVMHEDPDDDGSLTPITFGKLRKSPCGAEATLPEDMAYATEGGLRAFHPRVRHEQKDGSLKISFCIFIEKQGPRGLTDCYCCLTITAYKAGRTFRYTFSTVYVEERSDNYKRIFAEGRKSTFACYHPDTYTKCSAVDLHKRLWVGIPEYYGNPHAEVRAYVPPHDFLEPSRRRVAALRPASKPHGPARPAPGALVPSATATLATTARASGLTRLGLTSAGSTSAFTPLAPPASSAAAGSPAALLPPLIALHPSFR